MCEELLIVDESFVESDILIFEYYEFPENYAGPSLNNFRTMLTMDDKLASIKHEMSYYNMFLDKFIQASDIFLRQQNSQLRKDFEIISIEISNFKLIFNKNEIETYYSCLKKWRILNIYGYWFVTKLFKWESWKIMNAYVSRTSVEDMKRATRAIQYYARYFYESFIEFKHILFAEALNLELSLSELQELSSKYKDDELMLYYSGIKFDNKTSDIILAKLQHKYINNNYNPDNLNSVIEPDLTKINNVAGTNISYMVKYLIDYELTVKDEINHLGLASGINDGLVKKYKTIDVKSKDGLNEIKYPGNITLLKSQIELAKIINKIIVKKNNPVITSDVAILHFEDQIKNYQSIKKEQNRIQLMTIKNRYVNNKINTNAVQDTFTIERIYDLYRLKEIEIQIRSGNRSGLNNDAILAAISKNRLFVSGMKPLYSFVSPYIIHELSED